MSFTHCRRDLWLVVAAKAVSWLGDSVAMVAMTLRLQSDGRGPGAVAALLMANLLPILLLSSAVGRLVDRRDSRALLVLASLAQAAVCAALAATSPAAAVLCLVALLGAGQAVSGATWQALLPAIVGADALPAAIGRTQAATTLAGVAAPALGGLLTGLYGAGVPLLVDSASFVAVAAAAVVIGTRRAAAAGPGSGERSRGGLSIVRRDDLLRPLFALLALFVLLGSLVNVVEVFLVRETLHASTTWYGLSGATFSLGALAGAVGSGRLRGAPALARGFVASTVGLAAGLATLAVAPSVVWVLPIGFVAGAGNGVLNVTLSSLVLGRARAGERGRVGALLNGVASGTQLGAYAASGLLAAVLSPRAVFGLAGGLGLLAPVLLGRAVVRATGGAVVRATGRAGGGADSAEVITQGAAA